MILFSGTSDSTSPHHLFGLDKGAFSCDSLFGQFRHFVPHAIGCGFLPPVIIVGYSILLHEFAASAVFTFSQTCAYPQLAFLARKLLLGILLGAVRGAMVLRNCPEQEIEDALGNFAAAAEALFGAVGALALYKNKSLLYLAPAAFVGGLIEIGGKGYVTIGTVKTAATAGKRKLGTAEEKRVTRLLSMMDITVAEGGVRPLRLGWSCWSAL